ncbi:MAG: hypothetical protein KC777_09925, partial [Cyanobacteria bacterium HKST-UBA02]|nr:hypothetical protein [Cyanobacteria bacterium HKST-UBA02]
EGSHGSFRSARCGSPDGYDEFALSQPEFPVLFIDLFDTPGRELRVIARAVQNVENNLSISNMDFEEFAESADADGIYRQPPPL